MLTNMKGQRGFPRFLSYECILRNEFRLSSSVESLLPLPLSSSFLPNSLCARDNLPQPTLSPLIPTLLPTCILLIVPFVYNFVIGFWKPFSRCLHPLSLSLPASLCLSFALWPRGPCFPPNPILSLFFFVLNLLFHFTPLLSHCSAHTIPTPPPFQLSSVSTNGRAHKHLHDCMNTKGIQKKKGLIWPSIKFDTLGWIYAQTHTNIHI